MWLSTTIGFKIDLGRVLASILLSWGCFWELLGAWGRPWGLPCATLEGTGGGFGMPGGLLRESLEYLQERLGTSLGHLAAAGVDLGRYFKNHNF